MKCCSSACTSIGSEDTPRYVYVCQIDLVDSSLAFQASARLLYRTLIVADRSGTIPQQYRLIEADVADYTFRTRQNVFDSDGTLILYAQRLTGGTLLTNRIAKELGRPLHRIRVDREVKLDSVANWILEHQIAVLNVAGPRLSSNPGIDTRTFELLCKLFRTPRLPGSDVE